MFGSREDQARLRGARPRDAVKVGIADQKPTCRFVDRDHRVLERNSRCRTCGRPGEQPDHGIVRCASAERDRSASGGVICVDALGAFRIRTSEESGFSVGKEHAHDRGGLSIELDNILRVAHIFVDRERGNDACGLRLAGGHIVQRSASVSGRCGGFGVFAVFGMRPLSALLNGRPPGTRNFFTGHLSLSGVGYLLGGIVEFQHAHIALSGNDRGDRDGDQHDNDGNGQQELREGKSLGMPCSPCHDSLRSRFTRTPCHRLLFAFRLGGCYLHVQTTISLPKGRGRYRG